MSQPSCSNFKSPCYMIARGPPGSYLSFVIKALHSTPTSAKHIQTAYFFYFSGSQHRWVKTLITIFSSDWFLCPLKPLLHERFCHCCRLNEPLLRYSVNILISACWHLDWAVFIVTLCNAFLMSFEGTKSGHLCNPSCCCIFAVSRTQTVMVCFKCFDFMYLLI